MEQICPPTPPYTHKFMNEYDYDVQRKKTEKNVKVPIDTNFHWSLNILG